MSIANCMKLLADRLSYCMLCHWCVLRRGLRCIILHLYTVLNLLIVVRRLPRYVSSLVKSLFALCWHASLLSFTPRLVLIYYIIYFNVIICIWSIQLYYFWFVNRKNTKYWIFYYQMDLILWHVNKSICFSI